MKFKQVALLIVMSSTLIHCNDNPAYDIPEESALRSSNQQQMIAHFFNIVIQGLLLASAEKKEDKLQAAANAVNSLSTITQLTVRSPLHTQALVTYVDEHREEILTTIASHLDLIDQPEPHNEHVQID